MDDENTAPEPAHWRTRFKDASAGLWSWVERWNDPKAQARRARGSLDGACAEVAREGGGLYSERAGPA